MSPLTRAFPSVAFRLNHVAWHLTKASSNKQTGPIPVSTSPKSSCPASCHLKHECYAKKHFVNMHWDKVSRGERGTSYSAFCNEIRRLPYGQLWRHNQAGDLHAPARSEDVLALIKANRGKRGFTYTAHPHSFELFRHAKQSGFTINMSCDSQRAAAAATRRGIPAVYSGAPVEYKDVTAWTFFGVRFVVCPHKRNSPSAQKVQCSTCQLCHTRPSNVVIVFPLH